VLVVDREESARVRARLSEYLANAVDDGERLRCKWADGDTGCRESVGFGRTLVEGQLSHVGSCYSLQDNGRPIRILVVPNQVGGSLDHDKGRGTEHVTVDGRAAQVDSAKSGDRPHPRTPHMDGTALAIKVLLGIGDGGEETLSLGGELAHVFDCYSMANATLCSRVDVDSSGQGSDTMFKHCLEHLRRTFDILAPNVVIAQGWRATGWSPSRAVAEALDVPKPAKNSCSSVATGRGRVALVAVVHPARYWMTSTMPSWRQVRGALQQARSMVKS
jgi:hypothetical protein